PARALGADRRSHRGRRAERRGEAGAGLSTLGVMRLPHVLALLLGAGSCTAPERKPTGECPPIHAGLAQGKDPKPVRAGRFDHAPVATCTGNLLQEEFQDLRAWSPRSTAARELYENASFEPPAVSVSGGKLAITASFGKGDGTGCLDEHGGQVTYAA